jgi:hypothetical protein
MMADKLDAEPTQADAPGREAPASPDRLGPLAILERTAGIQLSNRLLWLVFALGLYALLHLSYLQWHSSTALQAPQFDTLELMALLMAVIEATLLLAALVLACATPATRTAWYRRHPHIHFSYIASGIAGAALLLLLLALLLAPVLFLHRYPELVTEAGMRIPLMMLQRALLVACTLLVSYNLMLLLHHVARLPLWLAGILGMAAQAGLGYATTSISYAHKDYERLNDVFYYNQLWRYFDWFPKLQARQVFHNIEMPYFGYYLGLAAIAAVFLMLLWLPRASTRTTTEILSEDAA